MAGICEAKKDELLGMIGDRVVTAAALAKSIGRSERTVYRLIGELKKAGHPILSDPGVGYMVRRRPVREAHRNG